MLVEVAHCELIVLFYGQYPVNYEESCAGSESLTLWLKAAV